MAAAARPGLHARLVLDHPRLTLLVVAWVVGLLATQAPGFRLDASSDSLVLEDDAALRAYP